MINYFAYGSNMDIQRIRDRGVSFKTRRHAFLKGWSLKFNKISSHNPKEGFANIVQDEDGIIEGILYEVEQSDLQKLNHYEGLPTHYNRITVKVELEIGRAHV